MNLTKACDQLKAELKDIFDLDVEVIPTQVDDKELGFTMFHMLDKDGKITHDASKAKDEKTTKFHFNPLEKWLL
jgi:hypothetical protein